MNNLQYLAGFFDGEGCISCSIRRNPNNNNIYFRSAIQVGQVDRAPLDLFQSSYGGYIYYYERPAKEFNRKPYFVWRLSSNGDALRFLREIEPFLLVKRQQALDMIDRIESYVTRDIVPKDGSEVQRDEYPFSH